MLGIVVVIVAILGIAVWGATGDDPGTPVASASGGGATIGVPAVPSPGTARAPASGGILPAEQIERWRQLRAQERDDVKAAENALVPPATTSPLARGPLAGAESGAASDAGVALKADAASDASGALPMPQPASVTMLKPTVPPVTQPVTQPSAQPVAPTAKPATAQPAVTTRKPEPVEPKSTVVTVAEGETLWRIAVRHYGDSNIQEHVDAILAANPSLDTEHMSIGTRITLPPRQTLAVSRLSAEKQVQLVDGSLYEVRKGDTLSDIAKAKLGSASRWQDIYDLNRERIVDPAVLFPGTTLRLPKN